MPRRSVEQDIDRLYQLSPNEFTNARNALAKELGGTDGKRIKALPKPSVSAWAVNQLYWRDHETYEALTSASGQLRAAHRAVLGGKKADLRAADAAHRAAVKEALTSTLRLVKDAGLNVSAAAQTEIARTLESLPADETPGRLAKPLRPEGFEALQGMPIRAGAARHLTLVPKPAPKASSAGESRDRDAREREAREQETRERKEAQRLLQAARTRERQDRSTVERLQKRVAAAEQATEGAKRDFDRAQRTENQLRSELEQAEQSLKHSAKALADLT